MHILKTSVRHEPEPTKGSRFVADVCPVSSPEEAKAYLAKVRAEFSNASHHCWAWRLLDGQQQSSDDGEPGGSAGRPILAQIVGHEVADVVVVVTRWFGGTKLGVGGLVRAYGGAAGQALDRAELEVHVPRTELEFVHAYADESAVEAALREFDAKVVNADFGADVRRRVSVPSTDAEAFAGSLEQRTSGRVVARSPIG